MKMLRCSSSRYLKLGGLVVLTTLLGAAACINPRIGYAPEQPVRFSHQLHAGQNQIPCRYCHVSVGEGAQASIPSVNVCMNCHNEVAVNREEVKRIRAAWQQGKPLRWIKVHDLPDHVRFSHQPHIMRGLDCVACHGQINTMEVVSVQNPFNMGWCVNCHRQPQYNAPVDCFTCHY